MTKIDFVPYPPTIFPFRDLLVLENLELTSSDTVCEIGIGSGETTARLAILCKQVVGFEISEKTVEALQYLQTRHSNLQFVVSDITQTETIKQYRERFSKIVSCDTLEHVTDPKAFFAAICTLLKPGGEFLVTFPNEPIPKMHGVTRFDDVSTLSSLLTSVGLSHRIGAARLTNTAAPIAKYLGEGPLNLVRQLLRRNKSASVSSAESLPQTFEETQFFKRMNTWRKLSPAMNLYWYGVLKLMNVRGPSFSIDWDFRYEPFCDSQIVILGKKQ